MGMMIMISSNGSRLDQPRTLDLLATRGPYQLALSLYGATRESYDGMTRRRGSFRRFMRGLAAAHEAGLPMRINIVVSNRNAHQIPQMRAIADRYGIPSFEFTNISPTINGGGEVLPSSHEKCSAPASHTPAATPGSPTSTPTRTAERPSARSAATPRSI
jgi:MoaA/NifB/PqqE/SkfB family radical SAM enzyme